MSVTVQTSQPRRRLVRVLAYSAPPFDPAEVVELAVADVLVDGMDAEMVGLLSRGFGSEEWDRDRAACTPLRVCSAVWGRRDPDVLAAHDAATAARVFAPAITGGLPWLSLHKVSRRVWPGQESYALEALALWRSWAGRSGPFAMRLPSGAAREALLAAGLVVELLRDPGLRDVGEAFWLERAQGQTVGNEGRLPRCDALEAALVASNMPSRPLRQPPWPFDDQREWASVGTEDLRHFARFGEDDLTAEAARAELRSRAEEG